MSLFHRLAARCHPDSFSSFNAYVQAGERESLRVLSQYSPDLVTRVLDELPDADLYDVEVALHRLVHGRPRGRPKKAKPADNQMTIALREAGLI